MADAAYLTTAQDIVQWLVSSATSVAVPITGSACVTPWHHQKEINNQGIDIDPGATVEEQKLQERSENT